MGSGHGLADSSEDIENENRLGLKPLLNAVVQSITLHLAKLIIRFNLPTLSGHLNIEMQDDPTIELFKPLKIKRRGQELKLVIDGIERATREPNLSLFNLIAEAQLLKSHLEDGVVKSIKGFAAKQNMDHGDAKNLHPLCYLTPSIIEDICTGREPADFTVRDLKQISNLPVRWDNQRRYLGFT